MPQQAVFGVRHLTALAMFLGAGQCLAATDLQAVVDASVKPLMQQQAIPGLAVAVVQNGKVQYFSPRMAEKWETPDQLMSFQMQPGQEMQKVMMQYGKSLSHDLGLKSTEQVLADRLPCQRHLRRPQPRLLVPAPRDLPGDGGGGPPGVGPPYGAVRWSHEPGRCRRKTQTQRRSGACNDRFVVRMACPCAVWARVERDSGLSGASVCVVHVLWFVYVHAPGKYRDRD